MFAIFTIIKTIYYNSYCLKAIFALILITFQIYYLIKK